MVDTTLFSPPEGSEFLVRCSRGGPVLQVRPLRRRLIVSLGERTGEGGGLARARFPPTVGISDNISMIEHFVATFPQGRAIPVSPTMDPRGLLCSVPGWFLVCWCSRGGPVLQVRPLRRRLIVSHREKKGQGGGLARACFPRTFHVREKVSMIFCVGNAVPSSSGILPFRTAIDPRGCFCIVPGMFLVG